MAAHLPIGYVRSLEGADSLVTLDHVERAWRDGLRAIGPAHYGPGTYAQGTDATGGIGEIGRSLLKEMERLGFILDATHLCDDSFWEALDAFGGRVWASHNNCRALVPHNRQFSDDQIRALAARGAVIGVALDAWMLYPGWQRGVTTPQAAGVTLQTLVNHIDHICHVTGSARHVGIGSDLDGAFGREQTAADLETHRRPREDPGAAAPARLREGRHRGHRQRQLPALPARGLAGGHVAASGGTPAGRAPRAPTNP